MPLNFTFILTKNNIYLSMASSFGVAEALEVFQTIDAGGNGRLSKHELQTYCSENFIKWADVYTALSLDKMIIVSRASFLAAAEQGKLGVFQGKGNPGRTARNLDQSKRSMVCIHT